MNAFHDTLASLSTVTKIELILPNLTPLSPDCQKPSPKFGITMNPHGWFFPKPQPISRLPWMELVPLSGEAKPASTPKVVNTKEASTGAQLETKRGSSCLGKDCANSFGSQLVSTKPQTNQEYLVGTSWK